MANEEFPSLEEAYKRLRPLFFRALSRLTGQGRSASPTEALDLIHSFLLEEWSSIKANFDPDRGSLESYVFVAFTHFARRQLTQEERRNLQLTDHRDLERYVQNASEEARGARHDAEVIARALSHLSSSEIHILRRYLQIQSERKVASEVEMTRHRVRDTLSRALGRLALRVHSSTTGDRWTVTKEILQGGYTVRQAASKLGVPFDEARAKHEANLQALIRELQQVLATTGRNADTDMSLPLEEIMTKKEAVEVILQALEKGDDEAFFQIRDQAEEVLELLGENLDAIDEDIGDLSEVDPENLQRLYKELEEGLSGPEEMETEAVEQYEQLFSSEEAALGEAFGELIAGLKGIRSPTGKLPLDQPLEWLKNEGEEVSPATEEALRERPDVRSAPKEIANLVTRGITPVQLYRAIIAISDLVGEFAGVKERLTVTDESVEADNPDVDKYLLPEVGSFGEMDRDVANQVVRWAVCVSEYKNLLFPDYEAMPISVSTTHCEASC